MYFYVLGGLLLFTVICAKSFTGPGSFLLEYSFPFLQLFGCSQIILRPNRACGELIFLLLGCLGDSVSIPYRHINHLNMAFFSGLSWLRCVRDLKHRLTSLRHRFCGLTF